ncbi:MAG: hypothetical protein PHN59_00845 [Candidatus Omnitrophica bacterium]|nr:hypothetical protein [Candidatus Omnitrophota bacterium]
MPKSAGAKAMGLGKIKFKIIILIAGLFLSPFFCLPSLPDLFASDYDFSEEGELGIYEEPEFVTESGDAFSPMQEGFEGIESNSVDIVLPNANSAAIQELNKGMKELSSEARLGYVREHINEYSNAGAVTVFAGENIGEVVVNGSINSNAPVEYQPLGKPELGYSTALQGALLDLTKYPENANIKESTVPVLTYKLRDDKTIITAQKIVPGVLGTCAHGPETQPNQTINLGYVGIGEKEDLNHIDRQFVVDRVAKAALDKHAENDARLIILQNPEVLAEYANNPIPVMPIENDPPKKEDTTRIFLRRNDDHFGIRYPERFSEAEVTIDFSNFTSGTHGEHWTDHPVMSGHSGTFEYKLDNNGNIHLFGPVRAGFKYSNPSPFGIFTNPKVVTDLRDQLSNEYQRSAQSRITQSEKDAIMKQFSDNASREYDAQLKKKREERDKEFYKFTPPVHVSLPGDPK